MRARRPDGFTLIELMVALTLGVLVLAAALTSALGLSRRHRETDEVSRQLERAHHALGILETEIQMAGFGGLQGLTTLPWLALPAPVQACGVAERPEPVRIDASYMLGCPASGGGSQDASHVLTLLRAGGRRVEPRAGRVQVLTSRAAGGPQGLIYAGVLPADLALREGLHELRDLVVTSYYISRDSDGLPGVPALRIKELTEVSGRPAMRDTELVAGISSLDVEEAWQDAGVEGGLRFGPPGARPAAQPLVALRLRLRLAPDALAQPLDVERTVTLRNVPP